MSDGDAIRAVREGIDPIPPGWRRANGSDREGRTVTTRYGAGIGVALAVEAESDEAADHWDCNIWRPRT